MAVNPEILLLHLLIHEEERVTNNLRRRQLRDASDMLTIPKDLFKKLFRLTRNTAHGLLVEISPFFRQQQRPGISISHQSKLLAALHFLAQGGYQKEVGQEFYFPMSQPSVSRCLEDFVNGANDHLGHHVHFPATAAERRQEKLLFHQKFNSFPGIIAVIDGTHVAIQAPPTDHPEYPGILYYNRKGYYSLNVQIIASADQRILNVNARYLGSVHDSAIWTTSIVHQPLRELHDEDRTYWLLGDSGYPLQPWLMVPVEGRNLNAREAAFNITFRRCRNVVVRTIGVWKARFRCLLKHRVLHYDPVMAAKIINATAILHNYCHMHNDNGEDWEYVEDEPGEIQNNLDMVDGMDLNQGRATRNRIIQNYF